MVEKRVSVDSVQDLMARREAVVARGVGAYAGTSTAAAASGARITTVDGQELLDFATGIGVMNVGHGPREVIEAIQDQAGRLLHSCIHVATYEPYVALCEQLAELFPHGEKTKVMLGNSGAEAVENAIKIARQATGRPAVLVYNGAFHGRTLLGMTLTSKTGTKIDCGPFAPEVYRLPYPNVFASSDGLPLEAFVERELARLRDAFVTQVPAQRLAAVLIEVIQGEGGFVPAPVEYLRELRKICTEHGIALIFDEVQSGFCRSGRWAAYEHAGVSPDLSTWGKAMGGGLPISAVIGRAAMMDRARPGTLGGTFGGNPVSCAAALATIHLMKERALCAAAEAIGERIRERFLGLQEKEALVADVRGLGAMMAIELCHDRQPLRPATDVVMRAQQLCLAAGLLILPCGPYGNVLRALPPLTIDADELERGLAIIESSVLTAAAQMRCS